MDRRCVIGWLNEVYVTPSRAFDKYTEDELKMFAYDALVLLKEQSKIIRCKDCKHGADTVINGEYLFKTCGGVDHEPDWFCANGERR